MSSLLLRSELDRIENNETNSTSIAPNFQNEVDSTSETVFMNGTSRRTSDTSRSNSSANDSLGTLSTSSSTVFSEIEENSTILPFCQILFFQKKDNKVLSLLTWGTMFFFLAMILAPVILSKTDDTAFFGKNKSIIFTLNVSSTIGFMTLLYMCTKRIVDSRNDSEALNSTEHHLPTYKEIKKLKEKGQLEARYPINTISSSEIETVNEVRSETNATG